MSDTDWIAEAKRLGAVYIRKVDCDHPHYQCEVSDWYDSGVSWEVTGQGPTEQDAARDAVARLRALADRFNEAGVHTIDAILKSGGYVRMYFCAGNVLEVTEDEWALVKAIAANIRAYRAAMQAEGEET